jgi:AcrR family transcriptional regulator
MPMKKIEDKRVKRTKKFLKKALLKLLRNKHFHDITITDIVREADFNRGTFYIHYESKEELLEELINDRLSELLKAFRSTYLKAANEVSITELSITAIFEHFLDHKEYYQVVLSPNIHYNVREKMINLMKQHFKEDIEFITDTAIDIELFYTFRVHGVIGLILEWIENDCHHAKEYMAEQVLRLASLQTDRVYVKWNHNKMENDGHNHEKHLVYNPSKDRMY